MDESMPVGSGSSQLLECAGRAQRRRRFCARPHHDRCANSDLRHFRRIQSGVALRFPPHSKTLDQQWLRSIAAGIPVEWEVDTAGRGAVETMVGNRANYMVENFIALLEAQLQLTRKASL